MSNYMRLIVIVLVYSFSIQSWAFAHKSSAYLNKPTGSYGVGYKQLDLINTSACPNVFFRSINKGAFSAGNTSHCNEIELVVYYPSKEFGFSYYKPINTIIDDVNLFSKKVSDKDIKQIKEIKSYAGQNLMPADKHFPLIIFSPGYGVSVQEYENTIIDLVSHGYIVVGINSQFISGDLNFNGSKIAKTIDPETKVDKENFFSNSYSDLSFVYSYLKQNAKNDLVLKWINWKKVGLLGHSLGAAAVARFSYKNGITAIATEDLTIDLVQGIECHREMRKPFLHLFSTQLYSQIKNKSAPYLCKDNIDSPYKTVAVVGEQRDVNFSMHMNFTDYSTLQYFPPIQKSIRLLLEEKPDEIFLGTGNGYKIMTQINLQVNRFFDDHLK